MRELLSRIKRASITARLSAIAGLAIALLVLAGVTTNGILTRQLAERVIDPQLDAAVRDFLLKVTITEDGQLSFTAPFIDPRFDQQGSGRYLQLVRIDGGSCAPVWAAPSLYPSGSSVAPGLLDQACALGDGPAYFTYPAGGVPYRVAASAVTFPDAQGRYLVVASADPSPETQILSERLGAMSTTLVAIGALIIAFTAFALVWAGAAPLRRLADDVAAVRRGSREALSEDYPQELAPVAEELNALVAHNREVVERARRHVGNLAHALKTPIAVLRNAAGKSGADADGQIGPAVEEMERFVERQLRRARVAARAEAAAGATIAYRTPVAENIQDLIFMMEQKYDAKAVDLQLIVNATPTFRGEREDLLEMAANLIDNACKYGRSVVTVTLDQPTPESLCISVEDDGPGLTEDQISAAMARGARLDEAAPGQGLGLSILTETVALYQGEVDFDRSQALGGLRARLRLPAVD